jgi:hypothetical protein
MVKNKIATMTIRKPNRRKRGRGGIVKKLQICMKFIPYLASALSNDRRGLT